MIHFIGDIHGKLQHAFNILKSLPKQDIMVAIGDLGIGFPSIGDIELPENFKFIRGNHDNPDVCKQYHNYIGDYEYWPDEDIFFISGADSVDKVYRTPGLDWWNDEQLSHDQLTKAVNLYAETKPTLVVSHDCPAEIALCMLGKIRYKDDRTKLALQKMFEIHQPDEWIFGHYHVGERIETNNTKFRCLFEMEVVSQDAI